VKRPRISIRKVRLDRGGYANRGRTYFGHAPGSSIFEVYGEGDYQTHLRAVDRKMAALVVFAQARKVCRTRLELLARGEGPEHFNRAKTYARDMAACRRIVGPITVHS
jgi:hypothetical protein